MADLVPSTAELGLASPALGPWFGPSGGTRPNLTAPQADLSVSLSLAAGQSWLAPANGLVSYHVATATRPAGLARFRAENGQPSFTDGRVVILFRLLPEAELRLHALARTIPSANGATSPADNPTRPRIRWFAFETTLTSVTQLGQTLPDGFPATLTTDDDKAAYLGLKVSGSSFDNGTRPVTILRRPGDEATIVDNDTGTTLNGSFWAFDHRGRVVDAGAVAAWWSYLATVEFENLWASDDTGEQRTAEYDDSHTVHVLSAHEGPLSSDQRSRIDVTDLTATTGAQTLYARSGNSPAVGLSAATATDHLPVPRMALLPHGTYDDPAVNGATLLAQWTDSTWPAALSRDFARLALVDVEQHLVGLDRTDPGQAEDRSRIQALRNSAPKPFLTRVDDATTEIMEILEGGSATVVMAPVMDQDWGPLNEQAFGSDTPPEALSYEVRGLQGEGADSSGSVSDQKVVVIFSSPIDDPLPADAGVRVWPHGIDSETGRRFRMDGGTGRVDADGAAAVVMPLPDGAAAPPVEMSFDVLIHTDSIAKLYVEQRFERPAVLSGSPLDFPASPGAPSGVTVRVCETGDGFTRATGSYGSGQTLLGIPDDPGVDEYALLNLASLDDDDRDPQQLRRVAGADDTLIVTVPAFGATPDGDVTASAPGGGTLVRRNRDGLLNPVTEMGSPAPTMERREVAAADTSSVRGTVAGTPGRASFHEALPAQHGHPGMPAAPEIHGVGAALRGPAVVPLIELLRERQAKSLLEFVQAAQIAPTAPAEPSGPTGWAAVLETITRGVVGDAATRAFSALGFTPGKSWTDLKGDIESATGQDLDTVIDSATFNDDDLARALDRMIGKTKDGSLHTAQSIQAAVARAEDFLYLETPCLDALSAASGAVDLVSKITTRLGERRGLVVLVACPERFLPDQPKKLEEVREAAISSALKAMNDAAPDRVALFVPTAGPDRRLHMATTTVVVDDAYALVGSSHLWRRGLTFDSALAVASFDETNTDGRPSAVRNLRLALIADRLGLPLEMIPDDPHDIVYAVKKLIAAGGLGRIDVDAFPARDDSTVSATQDAWNPDGGAGGVTDWFLFFTSLSTGVQEEISNAVR